MSTIPAVPDAVNHQPGFYAIIPASVRYCSDVPPAAKLLFGEIVALTSVKGYCYAQNPYFMELYGVDRATVKRWLSALAKQGFIKIELDGNARRIYALAMMPEVAQKRATTGAETRHYRRKNAPQSITGINTKINTLLARGPKFVGPGPVPSRELQAKEQGKEEQVTAPPQTVKSNPKAFRVEQAVARCGDLSARGRFSELWESVERSGRVDVWQDALDATKAAKNPSTGILGGAAAYFCAFVADALGELP